MEKTEFIDLDQFVFKRIQFFRSFKSSLLQNESSHEFIALKVKEK